MDEQCGAMHGQIRCQRELGHAGAHKGESGSAGARWANVQPKREPKK